MTHRCKKKKKKKILPDKLNRLFEHVFPIERKESSSRIKAQRSADIKSFMAASTSPFFVVIQRCISSKQQDTTAGIIYLATEHTWYNFNVHSFRNRAVWDWKEKLKLSLLVDTVKHEIEPRMQSFFKQYQLRASLIFHIRGEQSEVKIINKKNIHYISFQFIHLNY